LRFESCFETKYSLDFQRLFVRIFLLEKLLLELLEMTALKPEQIHPKGKRKLLREYYYLNHQAWQSIQFALSEHLLVSIGIYWIDRNL